MKFPTRVLPAAACALALTVAAPAAAAPVTVNLRIEGKTQTLFEGPITTDGHDISAPSVGGDGTSSAHRCDYSTNVGTGGDPRPTPTTAAYDAMQATGQTFAARWFDDNTSNFHDFFVDQLGPDGPSAGFWGFALNYAESSVGGCQLALAPGNDVLWAVDAFNKTYLKLSGPAAATVGDAATFTVTSGQTGAPIAGAAVGGKTTDGAGHVALTFTSAGTQRLKAEKADTVRSNAVVVNVTPKGTAQEPAPQPVVAPVADSARPVTRLLSPRNKAIYRARYAPRALRAEVFENGSGIKNVRMSLTRRVGKKCWQYSLKRERFVGIRCGKATYQTVTTRSSFDYLLPARLPRGRYVFDVTATDLAGNVDSFRSAGRNRAVFTVR